MTRVTHGLQVESIVNVPREQAFRAWTEPEHLQQWYRPSADWRILVTEVDLTVGGKYRFGFSSPEGESFYEVGEYREISPAQRLIFTCRFEGAFDEQLEETLSVINFDDLGDKTRIGLATHGYLRAEDRDGHQRGWPSFLEQLGHYLDQR